MIVQRPTPAQIAWVFEKLLEHAHAKKRKSLRALLAIRMGFDTDKWAYPMLQEAGGIELCAILNAAHREDA
ncbi:MAG: hypothetical protein ACLQVJ_17055 [Syntrophobacteraceae bacterium]